MMQAPPKPIEMRLYYINQSCALASHIVANEAGIPVQPVRVDLQASTEFQPPVLLMRWAGVTTQAQSKER